MHGLLTRAECPAEHQDTAGSKAANRAKGAALRSKIGVAMQRYAGPGRITAKRVLATLTRRPLPSVRTAQEHLRAIRAKDWKLPEAE